MSLSRFIRQFLYDAPSVTTLDGRHVGPPDPELLERNKARIEAAKVQLGPRWVGSTARFIRRL
jgi:hypothetical protein